MITASAPNGPEALFRTMAPEHRALLAAAAASLALHALVLLLFPGVPPAAPRAGGIKILTATLAPSLATPEAGRGSPAARPPQVREPVREKPESRSVPEPPRSAPVAPSSAPSAQRIPEVPANTAPAASGAAVAPAVPGIQGAPGATGASKSPLAGPRGQDAQGPAGTPGQSTARPVGEADAGTLDKYRLELITMARRYKRYPAQAMENGWQGKVEIRLVIGANGFTQGLSIRTSSGYEILDKQALDIVIKAKPLTPIPASLRGREFTIDIPVIFDLQTG